MIILANALFLTVAVIGLADEPSKSAPPDAKQIQKLIRELGADDFSVREKATKELSSIGRNALPTLRLALQSGDAEVRQRARRAMDAIQNSTEYLTESLKDQDPALRKEAAEIIERLGPAAKSVAPALVTALQDKDEAVRDAVLNALLAIDPSAEAVKKAVPAKAHVEGKYLKLLRRIRVPRDKESYGEFHDYGHYEGSEWAGFTDLPEGFWVYVYPHWYIWGETKNGK
jgi:HEAT repeat protein